MKAHQITAYAFAAPESKGRKLRFAVVADLHNGPWEDVRVTLESSDAVLVLGDIVNRHCRGTNHAISFVEQVPKLAPTFFSIGNHERRSRDMDEMWDVLKKSDMEILDNRYVEFCGLYLGGFSSIDPDWPEVPFSMLEHMERENGMKILMCHHPEYFPRYIAGRNIDLTLSGHAHGGQIQIAGHGLYAPGQGLFPRLTDGYYYDRRLLVSRGMTNSARAPRIWNPMEILTLEVEY